MRSGFQSVKCKSICTCNKACSHASGSTCGSACCSKASACTRTRAGTGTRQFRIPFRVCKNTDSSGPCTCIVMGISSGELKGGEQLPTVRALALEIGINTMTVSKTYQLLKQEGYIMTDRKNGARVRENIAQSGVISDSNRTELKRIVSEARLSGVSKEELKELIDEFYSE